MLPLHVFEPRYRRLINDVLGTDRRVGVFLLKPQVDEERLAGPGLFDVGCLGEIVRADALPDGRFNLLLAGLARVRMQEFLTEVPYPVAGAVLEPDRGSPPDPAMAEAFRSLTKRYWRGVLGRTAGPDFDDASAEALVNAAAANVEAGVYDRQTLLETPGLPERMGGVAELMTEQIEAGRAVRMARGARPADPRVN